MNINLYQCEIYLRRDVALSPADMADLNEYFTALRVFYDIPASKPVFPDTSHASDARPEKPASGTVKATGRNRADHPWRNSL